MAASQPSLSLFEAVTNKDYDTVADLYADNAKRTIASFLAMRNRWSPFVGLEKSEEKCNEFLQQVACQESKLGYITSEQQSPPPVHSLGPDDLQYHAILKELGAFLTERGREDISERHNNNDDDDGNVDMDCDHHHQQQQQPWKKTRQQAKPFPGFASKPFAAAAASSSTLSTSPASAPALLSRSDSNCEASEGVNRLLWDSAAIYSDARPPSNFVVYNANASREEGPPLFDGSVANSTPPPLGGISAGPSGGSGTILHLACALDLPLALAFLLAMGADARATHTAFRRLMIHEAACNGSIQCLTLLLELGRSFAQSGGDDEKMPWKQNLPESARQTSPSDVRFFVEVAAEQQGKHPTAECQRTRGFFTHPSMPSPEKCKGDFVKFLRLFRDYTVLVKNGFMSELDAARSIISQSCLAESSKVSLAHSCAFQKGSIGLSRGIFRPRGGGCADGHGNTPLHWAAFKNEAECAALLLRYNADPNARAQPSGWTALHDSSYNNATEVIDLLLDAGAHVDARANSGATPLCFAAQEDSAEAAQLLLQRGADLTARCAGGPYPRNDEHGFGAHNHHPHSRFSGYTPLHYCAHYNANRAARVLLQRPLSKRAMEIADLSERLPIHVAVARGSSDVLRELLHAGARVETRSRERSMSSYSRSNSSGSTGSNESPATTPRHRHRQRQEEAPQTPTRDSPNGSDASIGSTTPVSSPVLRAMIPAQPITSSKPWNCLSQQNIDECRELISHAERNWAPDRHLLFTPADRRAVLELLRVGKRLEQQGTGIFIDLWPEVLSFCGRGWFEVDKENDDGDTTPMEECLVLYREHRSNDDDDHLMLPSLSR